MSKQRAAICAMVVCCLLTVMFGFTGTPALASTSGPALCDPSATQYAQGLKDNASSSVSGFSGQTVYGSGVSLLGVGVVGLESRTDDCWTGEAYALQQGGLGPFTFFGTSNLTGQAGAHIAQPWSHSPGGQLVIGIGGLSGAVSAPSGQITVSGGGATIAGPGYYTIPLASGSLCSGGTCPDYIEISGGDFYLSSF